MPTSKGNPCVLLDVGANVDCKAQNLEQFAVMGEMYARSVLKIVQPRVGLLSIGEEETKGNELTREAFPLLKALPINFIGNVEGRDIFNGQADVIVCDGFVGNVALKTSEGIGRFVRDVLRSRSLAPSPRRWARCSRAAPSTTSAAASTTPNTAARRCSACAASASSATAPRMTSPSTTASAWPTSSRAPAPTSASSRPSPAGPSRVPIMTPTPDATIH